MTLADAGNNDDAAVKDYGSDGEDTRKSETPTPEVDDEGEDWRVVEGAAATLPNQISVWLLNDALVMPNPYMLMSRKVRGA